MEKSSNIYINDTNQAFKPEYPKNSKFEDIYPVENKYINYVNYNFINSLPTANHNKEHFHAYSLPNSHALFQEIPYDNSFGYNEYEENILNISENEFNNSIFYNNQTNTISPYISKVLIKTIDDEDFVYVNMKQYFRILLRREKRKMLNYCPRFKSLKKQKYVHESRHQHAVSRKRNKGGRFEKKQQDEN